MKVEIADTDAERKEGLSQREFLKEREGMLFLFKEPGYYGFWMRDMNFAIDIIWINEKKQVAEITPNVAPSTFPETFYPAEPIQYVLETQAGFAEKNMIMPGDRAQF